MHMGVITNRTARTLMHVGLPPSLKCSLPVRSVSTEKGLCVLVHVGRISHRTARHGRKEVLGQRLKYVIRTCRPAGCKHSVKRCMLPGACMHT